MIKPNHAIHDTLAVQTTACSVGPLLKPAEAAQSVSPTVITAAVPEPQGAARLSEAAARLLAKLRARGMASGLEEIRRLIQADQSTQNGGCK